MPITIRHGWRSRARQAAGAAVGFGAGVVAATADAPPAARVVAGVVFVLTTYALVDALVLGSSWRLTANELKIPTTISRRRAIAGGDDLVVSAAGRWVGAIAIAGSRGTRFLTVNPLVSPTDLRRWFARIADDV